MEYIVYSDCRGCPFWWGDCCRLYKFRRKTEQGETVTPPIDCIHSAEYVQAWKDREK